MRVLSGVLLSGGMVLAAPAQADFQVSSTHPVEAVWSQPTPDGIGRNRGRSAAKRRSAPSMALSVAHGFGRRVPLDFAVRQIVPGKVTVAYGSGVDPQAIVDWTGGRSWTEALRSAVRPLGLRVTAQGATVTIIRG